MNRRSHLTIQLFVSPLKMAILYPCEDSLQTLSGTEFHHFSNPSLDQVDCAFPPSSEYTVTEPIYINNFDLPWRPYPPRLDAIGSGQPLGMCQDIESGSPSLYSMHNFAPPYRSIDDLFIPQPAINWCDCHHFTSEVTEDSSDMLCDNTAADSEGKHPQSDCSDCDMSKDSRLDSDLHQANSSRPMDWNIIVRPLSQSLPRDYVCSCGRSFGRPEHRRRHFRTVHEGERDYYCKVPDCRKAFTRGDNLRDHYWTHVNRGGRKGKNTKFSLNELKEILVGPRDRKVLGKMKEKLRNHMREKRAEAAA
jgi:hypothetical protein